MIDIAMMKCNCGCTRFEVFLKVGDQRLNVEPGMVCEVDAPVYGVRCGVCKAGQSWAQGQWKPSKFVADLAGLS